MMTSRAARGASTTALRLQRSQLTQTTSRAFAASSTGKPQRTVQPPTAAEPPIPPAPSSAETSMPWNGWFSSFLKSKLGDERYSKLRELLLWAPDDIHNLEGIPNPSTKVPISKADPTLTAQFRYPSPGSRKPANVPGDDPGSDPYFIAHYVRDARRRGTDPAFPNPDIEKAKVELMPENDPRVKELKEKLEAGPGSSPGNKGMFATGKTDYDPTGLRATMSTNWEEMDKSLDRYMPDHLPTCNWEKDEDEIIEYWESKRLPVPPGRFDFGTVPKERRVARWGGQFGGGIYAEEVQS